METFWYVFLCFCTQNVVGELYSALAGMEELLHTQKTIIAVFDRYLEYTNAQMNHIQRVKDDYQYLLDVSGRDFSRFVSNPLNAFVLIKKLTTDWNEAQQAMFGAHQEIMGMEEWKNALFPDYSDLLGAAQALLRLQKTYQLETTSLANGILMDTAADVNLTASDCFELGRQAFYSSQFDYSILWLEIANEKLMEVEEEKRNKEGLPDKSRSAILQYLTLSTFEKGRSSAFQFAVQLGFQINEQVRNFSEAKDVPRNETPIGHYNSQTNPLDEAMYRQLCGQGKTAVSTGSQRPFLQCRHVVEHPYYVLQPIKEEPLSLDPKISVFYDVITSREIEILKLLALPKLERAEVAQYVGNLTHGVSENRVTKIAWLTTARYPTAKKIYRRIEDITGLSSQSAEPLQIANYGLGGHFHLHMDVLPNSEAYFGTEQGNRIATWLIYLSDVENGGATVFPRLNITVWPQKGSALFWYNIRSNGIGDYLTIHGACPVITGSKWISNAWLHERGQEFLLRCSLDQQSQLVLTRK